MQLLELSNGDLINTDYIIYVHPSKTEEKAYLYLKDLYHHNDQRCTKMIEITLEDYEKIKADV